MTNLFFLLLGSAAMFAAIGAPLGALDQLGTSLLALSCVAVILRMNSGSAHA